MQELHSILQLLEDLSAAIVPAKTCWRSSSALVMVMLLTWRLPYQLLSAAAGCMLPAVLSTFQGKAEFYVLSHNLMTLFPYLLSKQVLLPRSIIFVILNTDNSNQMCKDRIWAIDSGDTPPYMTGLHAIMVHQLWVFLA